MSTLWESDQLNCSNHLQIQCGSVDARSLRGSFGIYGLRSASSSLQPQQGSSFQCLQIGIAKINSQTSNEQIEVIPDLQRIATTCKSFISEDERLLKNWCGKKRGC